MSLNLDKIVEHLPSDLTETGIKEISDLINEVVEERVSQEVSLLESKVSGFLRTKVDELKTVAKEELQAKDDTYRSMKIYEAIKTLIAGEISAEDGDGIVKSYSDKVEGLEETVKTLNTALEHAAHENHLLEGKIDVASNEVNQLMEENQELSEQASLPFKSSESALVITNDTDTADELSESSDNQFLTEDIIRLSRVATEEN